MRKDGGELRDDVGGRKKEGWRRKYLGKRGSREDAGGRKKDEARAR